jgi:hypothetical protein
MIQMLRFLKSKLFFAIALLGIASLAHAGVIDKDALQFAAFFGVTGLFNSQNFVTDTAKKSYAEFITRLMPNGSAPLFGLTSQLTSGDALQFEHGYYTKTMLFPNCLINNGAGYTNVNTVFAVDTPGTAGMLAGMMLRVQRTGEILAIASVDSGVQITTVRAVGTIAAAALLDNDALYSVGNSYEEASTRPTSQYILPARVTNYTQIFRNSWSLTKTVAATKMFVGDTNIAENRQDCAMFHATDIEKAIWFGQKFLGTRNGQPLHLMDGLINIITSLAAANVTTAGGTTNYTQLEAALDPCFNTATDPKVANERVLFVGGSAFKVLNNIGRLNGTYQLMDGQTSYGLQFRTLKITRGTFRMIEHPLFNSNVDWAKMAVAVDLSSFRLMWLRHTTSDEFNMNGTPVDSGTDSVGGTLTSELTTEIRNPSANAIIYGLTAAAVG